MTVHAIFENTPPTISAIYVYVFQDNRTKELEQQYVGIVCF